LTIQKLHIFVTINSYIFIGRKQKIEHRKQNNSYIFIGQNRKVNTENKKVNERYEVKKTNGARCQWLMPVILATWEAEIERIMV
jgi:hypothetical protein